LVFAFFEAGLIAFPPRSSAGVSDGDFAFRFTPVSGFGEDPGSGIDFKAASREDDRVLGIILMNQSKSDRNTLIHKPFIVFQYLNVRKDCLNVLLVIAKPSSSPDDRPPFQAFNNPAHHRSALEQPL
jgi:hypothetical protein